MCFVGLNQVMNDDAPEGDGRQRTAATKVPAHHKSEVVDSDDRAHDPDSEPESVPSKFFSTKTLSLDVLWMWCLTFSLDFLMKFVLLWLYFSLLPPYWSIIPSYSWCLICTFTLNLHTGAYSLPNQQNVPASLHLYVRRNSFCPPCPGKFHLFKDSLFIFPVVFWGLCQNSDSGVVSGVGTFTVGFVKLILKSK